MKLYDTLSTEKREFTPNSDVVKMYVCGPNLYGPCHVGHALSYIYFDVLRRYGFIDVFYSSAGMDFKRHVTSKHAIKYFSLSSKKFFYYL